MGKQVSKEFVMNFDFPWILTQHGKSKNPYFFIPVQPVHYPKTKTKMVHFLFCMFCSEKVNLLTWYFRPKY
jgi:hypothetical protein